jgi:hypothetical protein
MERHQQGFAQRDVQAKIPADTAAGECAGVVVALFMAGGWDDAGGDLDRAVHVANTNGTRPRWSAISPVV